MGWRWSVPLKCAIDRAVTFRIGRRAALFAIAAALAACSRRGPAGGARVVSISPSATEAAFAIGAGDLVAGRSRDCDYPPEALRLPVVGGFADPNLEAILALAPSLVIGARGPAGPAIEQALHAHGVATFFPETESIAQIEDMLRELGKRLDREAGAAAAVGAIEGARKQVAAAVAGKPKVRAAFLFDVSPIYAAGPGSFPDELLREAGGVNVVDRGGAYPTLDLEGLLALDPDVILDGASDGHGGASRLAALKDARGWKDLRAMREGRVKLLSASAALRPGPRIGQGLIALAKALHGDAILPGAAP
jgi:iron complex transport system substrate-binding protein